MLATSVHYVEVLLLLLQASFVYVTLPSINCYYFIIIFLYYLSQILLNSLYTYIYILTFLELLHCINIYYNFYSNFLKLIYFGNLFMFNLYAKINNFVGLEYIPIFKYVGLLFQNVKFDITIFIDK